MAIAMAAAVLIVLKVIQFFFLVLNNKPRKGMRRF
jgi:hypothetical protein